MNILFVVSQPQDWPDDIPGVTVLAAQTYLLNPAYGDCPSTRVINLCRNTRYQSHGYYVSLLAEARGHRPLPGVQALKDLHSDTLAEELTARLSELMACALAREESDHLSLDILFGRETRGRCQPLCEQLFRLLGAPLLHARLERGSSQDGGRWHLCSLRAANIDTLPAAERALALQAAADYLKQEKLLSGAARRTRPEVAILCDADRAEAPSNAEALRKFVEAAETLGMRARLVELGQLQRLDDFDALFIRTTTNVDHYTYALARQAAEAGLVVIDDPDSILRCTNKIYLAELLARHHIPAPKTMAVHADNVGQIVPTLGLPCILKQPDGAFSSGVVKVESERQLRDEVDVLLRASELALAQEFLPTGFDWRVGVLDGRPLFVCKYYMAPGHWQVIKHERHRRSEGRTEALSVGEVPDEVVQTAVQAAGLIGDGFYGVDLKQVGGQVVVIEINDNPNVDAGNEDAVLGDALYREVMGVFRKRIDERKGSRAT